MREQRLEDMQVFIQKNKTVSIDTLCETFDVSRNTIHRDLNILAQRGSIKKTYGGVVAEQVMETIPFEDRSVTRIEQKRRIAQKAVELLKPGDSIFIDTGSTGMCFFQALPRDYNLTIFTNNVDVLIEGKDRNDTIVFTGGTFYRKTNSVIGTDAINTLSHYNIEKAFLSATGISQDYGATNSTQGEYQVKCAAVRASREIIMMVDSGKFDKVSLMTFCTFAQMDTLVTDCPPPDSYDKLLEQNMVRVIVS